MDIFDWIPGSYVNEIIQGDENPLDMARHINLEEIAMRTPVGISKPLVGLHPSKPSQGPHDEVEEKEIGRRRHEGGR